LRAATSPSRSGAGVSSGRPARSWSARSRIRTLAATARCAAR
jgi:hypothetical protein